MTLEPKNTFTDGQLVIHWYPDRCEHSGICEAGLSEVFNRNRRPWVNPENADHEATIHQLKRCPNQAFSFFLMDHHRLSEDTPGPAR